MKRYYYLLEIAFIFLISLTPLLWLRDGQIVLGHDSGFRLDPLSYLGDIWYSWNPLAGLGTDTSLIKGFLVAQLPEAIFTRLTGSLTTGQMLSFVFWFFAIGISMWLCVRNFFRESQYWSLRLIASTWYVYNLFLLQGWFITERAKFSIFAALPLLVTILWNTYEKRYAILRGSFLFGLTLLVFNGGGSPPLYGGILIALVGVTVYFLLQAIANRSRPRIVYIVTCLGVMGVVSVAFNAYWIVPQLQGAIGYYSTRLAASGGIAGILAWEASVNKHASLLNLMRLQGMSDWYDNSLHPYGQQYLSSPLLILASFIPVAAILIVLKRNYLWRLGQRERSFLFVCLAIFLVGLVMTAGSHPPFGFIYVFLIRYVPGFAIFRSAFYKFGPSVWFSAIALGSFAFWAMCAPLGRRKILHDAVTGILVGILWYHFPFFIGNFFVWNRPFSTRITVPSYVRDMIMYMNDRYAGRPTPLLILPPIDETFYADSYTWGFWSLDPFARLGLRVPVIANDIKSPIIDALYNAAVANNATLFYRLIRQTGIKKILWRDDVLYSDKLTASSNFAFMRPLLESSEIIKERESGSWTLYSVEEGLPTQGIIEVVPLMYRVDVDTKHPYIYENLDTGNAPVVFGGSLQSRTLEISIGELLRGNVLVAQCVLCDITEIQQLENIVTVPSVRFLPDSPFYAIVLQKEQRLLRALEGNPQQRIDADLGIATKRLVEIFSVISRDIKEKSDELVITSLRGFQERVEDAMQTSTQFSEIERNAQRAKILGYLGYFTKYLGIIDEKNAIPKDFITMQYEYLQNKSNEILRDLWITEAVDFNRYYLNIPWEGQYQLYVSSNRGEPTALTVDGEATNDPKSVFFKEGIHKLTLQFDRKNALSKEASISAEITLRYGQGKIFIAPFISYQDPYLLQFNYRVTRGKGVYMSVHQDNDAKEQTGNVKRTLVVPLLDDGIWHSASYIIRPNFGARTIEIVFFTADTSEKESAVSISDLSLQNIKPASVFAARKNERDAGRMPVVSFNKVNPSVYKVSVKDASSPYVLHFQQAYHRGWRAFVVSNAQWSQLASQWELLTVLFQSTSDTTNHFALNGYTNAWYLNQTGDYYVVLVYWPYIVFLIATAISAGSLLSALALAFWRLRWRHHYV